MSDLTPGTTFAPGQLVTAEILNRLVGDATINSGVINNTHISTSFINSQVELDTTTISDDDYFLVYDSSAGNHKKIKKSELATINNTQFTGGMITGEGDNKTTIDAVTGNITLQTGSIEAQEGSITAQSANINGGNLTLDTGGVYINGTGDGEGILDVKGALYVNKVFGNIELTGGIDASANLSANSISASGAITSGSALSGASLNVTGGISGGATALTGSLATTGDISGANGTYTGALGVIGNITNEGNITTEGSINATSGNISTINGTFSGTLAVAGDVSFSGTGLTNIGGAVNITGDVTADDIQALGNLTTFKDLTSAGNLSVTGDATLKGAVFGDNQVDFTKHLIMKAETSAGAGDGSNVYTDEIQTNRINDRNAGEITCDTRIKSNGYLEALGGLSAKSQFWLYDGEDPDNPDENQSAVLRDPNFKFSFIKDSTNLYSERWQHWNSDRDSHDMFRTMDLGTDGDSPAFRHYAHSGDRKNDLLFYIKGSFDSRRDGSATQYWAVYNSDSEATEQTAVWRKTETRYIADTTSSEYTTGKLIHHTDATWKDNDFMGADVLYDLGSTGTPFHLRCRGTFSTSGTKNFRINHPAEDGMDLRHCAIEGPKADLIYRGQVQLSNGYALVNINEATDMCDDTFVNLVRDVQVFVQNNDSWDQVKGSVDGNILKIQCKNLDSTAKIDWMVVAERNDPEYRNTLVNGKYETCLPRTDAPDYSTPK